MKYIKNIDKLNESFTSDMVSKMTQMARNPLKLNNYYMMTGEQAPVKDNYYQSVKDHCLHISMEFMEISEKSFNMLDRLELVVDKVIIERQDEFDTIVHNCKQRNFRSQYCAETEFHTVIQGRLIAMNDRPFAMGGFKI